MLLQPAFTRSINPQPSPTSAATSQPTLQTTQTPEFTQTPQAAQTPQASPQERTLQNVVEKGVTYCENIQEPYGWLMMNVMYRRFGITAFNDSLQRYDRVLALGQPDADLSVFRRIASYNNTLSDGDIGAVSIGVD